MKRRLGLALARRRAWQRWPGCRPDAASAADECKGLRVLPSRHGPVGRRSGRRCRLRARLPARRVHRRRDRCPRRDGRRRRLVQGRDGQPGRAGGDDASQRPLPCGADPAERRDDELPAVHRLHSDERWRRSHPDGRHGQAAGSSPPGRCSASSSTRTSRPVPRPCGHRARRRPSSSAPRTRSRSGRRPRPRTPNAPRSGSRAPPREASSSPASPPPMPPAREPSCSFEPSARGCDELRVAVSPRHAHRAACSRSSATSGSSVGRRGRRSPSRTWPCSPRSPVARAGGAIS